MKLRGLDVILWREELKRKIGMPTKAPHLQGVSKYICAGCERVFYYKIGDTETPQYLKIKGKTRQVCHRCFHKFDSGTDLRGPSCWLCSLRDARKARENGHIRDPRGQEEKVEDKRGDDIRSKPLSTKSQQGGVRGRPVLSSGRGTRNNKKNRRSR